MHALRYPGAATVTLWGPLPPRSDPILFSSFSIVSSPLPPRPSPFPPSNCRSSWNINDLTLTVRTETSSEDSQTPSSSRSVFPSTLDPTVPSQPGCSNG